MSDGVCSVADCETKVSCRGWCEKHYYRWRRNGDPTVVKRSGVQANPERKYRNGGYLSVRRPDHPAANSWGLVLEHRVVMEQTLGRYLEPGETVHHKNGVRNDNRPENLELWVVSQPRGQRPEDLVAWAHEILARYDARLSIEPERMSIVRGV